MREVNWWQMTFSASQMLTCFAWFRLQRSSADRLWPPQQHTQPTLSTKYHCKWVKVFEDESGTGRLCRLCNVYAGDSDWSLLYQARSTFFTVGLCWTPEKRNLRYNILGRVHYPQKLIFGESRNSVQTQEWLPCQMLQGQVGKRVHGAL